MSKKVFLIARSKIPQENLGEFVNDTVMEVVKSSKQFRGECGHSTWVYEIVRRSIAQFYRKLNRKKEIEFVLIGDDILTIEDPQHPDEMIELKELRSILKRALAQLRTQYQHYYKAFKLSFFDKMSNKQIAEYLNIPVGTVKSRIRNAKSKLRKYCISAGITTS